MDRAAVMSARRGVVAAIVLVVALLGAPAIARAASYGGYGETGWDYTNKAYCCEDAVAAAQENSARNCARAGGYADFRRSSARGRCDWEVTRGGSGRSVYRCTATATVNCR